MISYAGLGHCIHAQVTPLRDGFRHCVVFVVPRPRGCVPQAVVAAGRPPDRARRGITISMPPQRTGPHLPHGAALLGRGVALMTSVLGLIAPQPSSASPH